MPCMLAAVTLHVHVSLVKPCMRAAIFQVLLRRRPFAALSACSVCLLASCTLLQRIRPRDVHSSPSAMASTVLSLDAGAVDRMRGALWGTYIADALSMPVHWCVHVETVTCVALCCAL